jgi:hypothetical protein
MMYRLIPFVSVGLLVALWAAHADGQLDAVQLAVGGSYRYHRGQVLALLRETAEAGRG